MLGINEQVGLCSVVEQILQHDYEQTFEISIAVTNFDKQEVWNVVMSLPGGGDYYRGEFLKEASPSLWDHHSKITIWCINNLKTQPTKR